MKQQESGIQADIIKYLQSKKLWFCSIPNEGAGSKAAIRTAQLKTLGLRSGAPDLLVFLSGGKLLALEVKTPAGVQSPAQKHFEQKLTELNFNYYIVRSVKDVEKVLSIYGKA